MSLCNLEIRQEIAKRRIKYYEAAKACNVSCYTFSHWLQTELPDKKKREIIKQIRTIKP